jgi:hypothetical protein
MSGGLGVIWETSLGAFLVVTVFLGGGAAYLTGRAVALTWRPWTALGVYLVALTCAVRFIHYALFGGTLVSLHYFIVDLVVVAALAWLGQRVTRAGQMATQYGWLYRRLNPLFWARRA